MNYLVTGLLSSKAIDSTPFLAADVIDDWLNVIIKWGLTKALTIGGGFLLLVGLADMVYGLHGKRKDYTRAAVGVIIGIFGGFLLIVGASAWIKKAQMLGDAVPK